MDFINHVVNKISEMEKQGEELSKRVHQGIKEGRERIKVKSQRFEERRKNREKHFDLLNRKQQ